MTKSGFDSIRIVKKNKREARMRNLHQVFRHRCYILVRVRMLENRLEWDGDQGDKKAGVSIARCLK